MMKRIRIVTSVLLILYAILCFCGCSVKDDRTICPCTLKLDFSETDTSEIHSMDIFLSSESESFKEMDVVLSHVYPAYVMNVPKNNYSANIYTGAGGMTVSGKGLLIPLGEQSPEVYMHSSRINATDEQCHEKVCFHKNFCAVTVTIYSHDDFAYDINMTGNVCGYDVDGNPLHGNFDFRPEPDVYGKYLVRVPRQYDSSLMLEINDGTDVLRRFALGEYMREGGYDWSAPDLEDVEVEIDWSLTSLYIVINGWDWVYECEIVI